MSDKVITSEIFVAYSQCQRKAFLLLFTEEKGTPHEYVQIVEQQKRINQARYISTLKQKTDKVEVYDASPQNDNSDFLTEAILTVNDLKAACAVLRKVEDNSLSSYEPIITVGTYSITKEQKLELLFVGYVLEQVQKKSPATGAIISMAGQTHKLELINSHKVFKPFIEPLKEWIAAPPSEPPPVILNKHCPYCQFQAKCKAKAEKDDDLSLLDRITAKTIQKYHKKGIFTVKQLSYLFKPRRKRKKAKNLPLQHNLELQALAIRTEKIYLQELPELSRHQVELFLDIESIPDQNFNYLIGLLICEGTNTSYHSFWADTNCDEEQIWIKFLEKVNQYPEAPIYHYGSYEPKALEQAMKSYHLNCEKLQKRLVNVNTYIYGKIYFPVRSNSLKEIGKFIGAFWTASDASGLQSIVWRYHWQRDQEPEYKQILLTYNQEDCQALKLLIDELIKIIRNADLQPNIDFANQPKQYLTEDSEKIHKQFEIILKAAHADYDKKKITLKESETDNNSNEVKKAGQQNSIQTYRKVVPKARKSIKLPQREICPKCLGTLKQSAQIVERTIIDLVFTRNGVKKAVLRYWATKGYCRRCNRSYSSPSLKEFSKQTYGHGFQLWTIYHRISLRLPHRTIVQAIEEQFNETISSHTVRCFIKYAARYYAETEKILVKRLLECPFIHADETSIRIEGTDWCVWVFTSGSHVIFKLAETREATIAHDFLSDYKGILITDFYPGYDSIPCKQQKCWVHLIRDLNDALYQSPFDTEFETFVLEVKNLVVPIFKSIELHGLQQRHLSKFKNSVEQFYDKVITNRTYKSEITIKYQKRFLRYRESLFTFIEQNGIPWHNNTAENALRHLAKQREISGSFFENSTRNYLLLLGIRQTCRFQGKSFLKFLLSKEKDIDNFKASKRIRKTRPVGAAKGKKIDSPST